MQDFVKEPVLGLLKSVEDLAPEELMAGMARGAGSLLKHSVGGVANSVSLITGERGVEAIFFQLFFFCFVLFRK